ncbi:DUF4007 family protein [Flavobacterium subsaxonicum]|uniref:DUF4007 domain-containing protein n=1 Tax=Flavobacterium subsaxonicum WB 4.1-42 = DSM 21790 TaxID=1121898 RepID=A0A0A2MN04_9FLAO|nr:DUF4007 family protein [Flavobacterium subsaxonicum]KGO93659.1 hypothetical protein Q766_06775 [Flavobacterium subsaxonicum WB 4.1-42 = DSM 21790]
MDELISQKVKFTFSGHDTFHCRHLWLKKGFDFIKKGEKFSNDDAVVKLGVGRNMVSAINFWMKAFGIIDKNNDLTEFAEYIFNDNHGKDRYLEDEGTIWLLHYHLVKNNIASIYSLIFNDFRREKIEFTKDHFIAYVLRKAEEYNITQINKNTISADFEVLIKMYLRTDIHSKDREDTFSGILTEINILHEEKGRFGDVKSLNSYSIINDEKNIIPEEVILFVILDADIFDKSINLSEIEYGRNQPGSIFGINRTGLVSKLENITLNNKFKTFGITFNDHAGIKELQFKTKPNKFEILDQYYVN